MDNNVIAYKVRWHNELTNAKKNNYKQFEILNKQQAEQTGIAVVLLHGPPGSPYQGYAFRVQYNGQRIPFEPAVVHFIDIPWNPFVCFQTGRICCDIFKPHGQLNQQKKPQIYGWSPALTLQKVALSLISLLAENRLPQKQPGLNLEAAAEMNLKYSTFFAHAQQMATLKHYKKINIYKDEEKPPNHYPEDANKIDQEFMKNKNNFMQNPQILALHKIKKGQQKAKLS